jgi:coatomer subunit beta
MSLPFHPPTIHVTTTSHRYVNLSDIQLDIMDYIRPAECKNEDFRSMWAEFEWEVRFRHSSELLPM